MKVDIVLRAFDRIFEHVVCVDDDVEAGTIPGLWIIGMVALSEIAKHPLDRFRIGFRIDFQNFVIVDELRSCHSIAPGMIVF